MAVDLPELLRPTKHTSGPPGGGSWSSLAADVTKAARWRMVKIDQTFKGIDYCIIRLFVVSEIVLRSLHETSVDAQLFS